MMDVMYDEKINEKINKELEKGFAQDSNTFGEHDLSGQRYHPVQNNIGDTYNDFKIWCYSDPQLHVKKIILYVQHLIWQQQVENQIVLVQVVMNLI